MSIPLNIGFWVCHLRTWFWTAFYYSVGRFCFQSLGRGCRFEGWIDMPHRGGRIRLGDGVHVCRFVELSVCGGAELVVEGDVFIGRGVVISAHARVHLGRNALLAEYVCVHDNNHRRGDPSQPIRAQGFSAEPITIGEDCWIGAGAILLQGSGLGPRCIVGAGAVLTKQFPGPVVVAGVPARVRVPAGGSGVNLRVGDACA